MFIIIIVIVVIVAALRDAAPIDDTNYPLSLDDIIRI